VPDAIGVCDYRRMTLRRFALPIPQTPRPACVPLRSFAPTAAKRAHIANGFLWAAIAVCPVVSRHAAAAGFSDVAAITSQLFERGVALPPATPVLQDALFYTLENNWTVGISAAVPVRSPAKVIETSAQITRNWLVSDDWHMQASVLVYEYPSERVLHSYDRTEVAVGWSYRDMLTFEVSTARMAHKTRDPVRSAADLDLRLPLRSNFFLGAGIGRTQALGVYPYTHGPPYWYTYGHLGLGWSHDRWSFEVDCIANSQTQSDWPRSRTAPEASRWAATLARTF
jgi:hypothetical protein